MGADSDTPSHRTASPDPMGPGGLPAAVLAALPDGAGALAAVRAADGSVVDFEWTAANPMAEQLFGGPLAGRRLTRDGADGGCRGLSDALAAALASGAPVQRKLAAAATRWRVAASPLGDGLCLTVIDLGAGDPVRVALDHSTESFALFDADDRLVECYGRLKDFFPEIAGKLLPGAGFEELLRRYLALDPTAPPAGPKLEALVARRIARHRTPNGSFTFSTIGGRWLLTSERPTPDGGIVCIHTDVSALKEKEEELRGSQMEALAAKIQAERASRAKTEFLAHMSHELRTPLNAVMGFTELMIGETLGPLGSPRYRDYAQDIHDSGGHLLALINDILDLAGIEAGTMTLREEITDAGEAVAHAAASVRAAAAERGLTLEVDVTPGLPVLHADVRALRQMVTNLASNAVKFTLEGGHVLLSASTLPDGGIGIMVADTGVGIAADELPRLLEPFGRADGYKAREAEGTGLGLPIVKRLIEMHGGRLELTSEPGGTTAILLFPAERSLPRTLCPPPARLYG
ncbi:sensor histidine kinase [Azospirillum sp. sgz301742]